MKGFYSLPLGAFNAFEDTPLLAAGLGSAFLFDAVYPVTDGRAVYRIY